MRLAVAVAFAIALAACFTTAADFQRDAEEFIETNQELQDALGTTFQSATCQEPTSQDVGTTFACTALDAEGQSWEFEVEIIESNEYVVNVTRFP